jgi:hypothetical protein
MSRPATTRRVNLLDGQVDAQPSVDLATVRMTRAPAPAAVIGPVETGIPVPPKPGRQASEVCQVITELKPGQSRFFQRVDAKRLYGYVKRAREKGFGEEYAVRAIDDGHRVWRVK